VGSVGDSSDSERDLASLFESVTGRSTVTEHQEEGIPTRTLDGEEAAIISSVNDGLEDAIGAVGSERSQFDE
jgi:hypothetical protein